MSFIEVLPHLCFLTFLLIVDLVIISTTFYKLYQLNKKH